MAFFRYVAAAAVACGPRARRAETSSRVPEALDSAVGGRHQPTSNVVFTVFVALTSEASSTCSRDLEDHTGLCTRVAPAP